DLRGKPPQLWRNWPRPRRVFRREPRRLATASPSSTSESITQTPGAGTDTSARPNQGAGPMAKPKSLEDLFINLLKDIYYAEKQIVKALPKMAKAADSAALRRAFEHHLEETQGQVQRLERVFGLCDLKPSAKTCPAIKGILEEGKEDMAEIEDPDVLDAGMIADAQAVEHYEIARYG